MFDNEVLIRINNLFNLYFGFNSFLDDMVYALQSDYKSTEFADRIHKISHIMPAIADDVQEFAKRRGYKLKRGAISETDTVNLNSELSWIKKALEFSYNVESTIKEVIRVCSTTDNPVLEDFFRNLYVQKQAEITYQFIMFVEGYSKLEQEDLSSLWDSEYETYEVIKI